MSESPKKPPPPLKVSAPAVLAAARMFPRRLMLAFAIGMVVHHFIMESIDPSSILSWVFVGAGEGMIAGVVGVLLTPKILN